MLSSRGIILPPLDVVHVLASYDSWNSIVFMIPEDGGSVAAPSDDIVDVVSVVSAVLQSKPPPLAADPRRNGKAHDARFLGGGTGRIWCACGPEEIRDSYEKSSNRRRSCRYANTGLDVAPDG
ncbi:hypothetical protein COL516b_005766 [Colletotrichum fioriniae]|nr:uncharacterized protein COL516b_005766 [Colletotrichum fioriniae]KAJ0304412.1 hypothetical protein COL516b_005766 [Colletotrichum fioriniae]